MAEKFYSPKTSIIITVYNEEKTIEELIRALKNQLLSPTEIILVDGGSQDKTFPLLKSNAKSWPTLNVFQVYGNRAIGRNFGVSKAHYPIIIFTDAGCIPEKKWLEELVKPFADSATQIVSGYYKGLSENIFQACLIPYVLVMPDQVNPNHFLPSTRSMALRRSVWNKSGGFDPKLTHNEDYAYAVWLEKMGFKFVFTPKAVVDWIPRKNLNQAAWMFMRFAIGDIQSGIIRPKVKFLFIRYLVFLYLVLVSIQIHVLFYPLGLVILTYLIWSVSKNWHYVKKIQAIFWLPVIQLTADLSVMFGSVVGFLSRAFNLL